VSQPSFDLEDGERDEPGLPTFSVRELADAISGALHRSFADGVWVRGEIQGWNVKGPHAYFRLAEETEDGKASLNVQFFAPAQVRLKPLLSKHRLRLGDGMKVRIFGHLNYFAPSGQLGLKMSSIDPRFTLGEMAMQRDDVVRRLVAAGMYDRNKRLVVPPTPLRVGVVTSSSSAAWADFVHELERSGFAFELRLIDVRVQGERAVGEVCAALRTLGAHTDLDVVVLIRGGGSRTELATFDDEAIATAIAVSSLPVFTGLGHEVDRSVADEVAHSALKTPTACAAALAERVQAFRDRCEQAWSSIRNQVVASVGRADDRLNQRARSVRVGANQVVHRADAHLRTAQAAVGRVPARLDPELRHLAAVNERLRLLDPVNTLARGYSISRAANGTAVIDAASLHVGDVIVTTFAKGTATTRVEETTS
jgi:exodeoxyribonuclease VII large subunit